MKPKQKKYPWAVCAFLRHALLLATLVTPVMLCGVFAAESQEAPRTPYTPLRSPDWVKYGEEEAVRFNKVAKSRPEIYVKMAEYLLQRFNLAERGGIGIDIAGGSGDLVLELAARSTGFYWLNSDINCWYGAQFMADVQKRKLSQRANFIFADACALPFADNYADLILSRGSFQFWGDLEAAIKEMHRVLKPGGHVFIGRGFTPNMPEEEVRELLASGKAGGPKYAPQIEGERLQKIAEQVGAVDVEILVHKPQDTTLRYGVWLCFGKEAGPPRQ